MSRLLKGIFISLGAILLMSHNAFAADLSYTDVSLYTSITSLQFSCSTNGSNFIQNTSSCHLGSNAAVPIVKFKPNTTIYFNPDIVYYFEVYLRISNNANTPAPVWYGASSGDNLIFMDEEQVSSTTSNNTTYRTYRLLYKFTGNDVNLSSFPPSIYNSGDIFAAESFKVMGFVIWQTQLHDSAAVVQAINQQNQYLSDISQNLYVADQHLSNIEDYLEYINDHIDELNEAIDDQNQAEQDAVDNIENQSPEDISESGETENQATTNLIGLFQSFITALSNITQANNCNLQLAFPSYAGGTITVNVCQYKDKGGNIVAIFSSLTLIVFYIPLALKLLSMIYNEIRSFTNG